MEGGTKEGCNCEMFLLFLSWILGLHVLILHLRLRSSKAAIASRVAKLIGHRLTCFGEK